MRKITFQFLAILAFTGAFSFLSAQTASYQWADNVGGTSEDEVLATATDASGNLYVAGTFRGNITVGSSTLNSDGDDDIFVAKYDSTGAVQWAKRGGGPNGDFAYGLAVDGSGNVYVTGYYTTFSGDDVTFGSITKTGPGELNAFVAKYNSNGAEQWVSNFGGSGNIFINSGHDIAVDAAGNVYWTGVFTLDFVMGTETLSSPTSESFFVAKLNSAGTPVWAEGAGQTGTGADRGNGLSYDGGTGLYLTGQFEVNITFGSNSALAGFGGPDVFVAKYDTSGTAIWSVAGGGLNTDFGGDISVDGSGNSYVSGSFATSATFGSSTLNSNVTQGVFVAKVSSAGAFTWIDEPTSSGATAMNFGDGIVADPSGDGAVFCGSFMDSLQLGGNTLVATSGGQNGYVGRYNGAGSNIYWGKKTGLDVNDVDNLFGDDLGVGGVFDATESFDGNSQTSAGLTDGFAARLNQSVVGLEDVLPFSGVELYPNPASAQTRVSLQLDETAELSYRVLDLQGRELMKLNAGLSAAGMKAQQFDITELEQGVYLLEIAADGKVSTEKLVVMR